MPAHAACITDLILLTADTVPAQPACLSRIDPHACSFFWRLILPAVCLRRLHIQACLVPILHLSQVTVDERVLEKLTIDEMKDIVAADPTQAFTVNEAEAKVS